jgi:hypothetical protein
LKIQTTTFLNSWINSWVLIFCTTVIAIEGHGGEAALVLISTMGYLFLTKHDDLTKYKLNRDEITLLHWYPYSAY